MTISNTATTSATANLASITRTSTAKTALQTKGSDMMGKSDFLTLFTAQLKNQDPTDPVKNEAFVAQLAQFSQLEATTNMANALTQMAASTQGDRMMTAAGLIGRSVTAAGLPAILSGGQPVSGTVSLPNGASSVQLDVFDASGKPVRSVVAGSQQAGTPSFTWDGLDNSGNPLADGVYSITATATVAGTKSTAAVNMTSTVQSVSSDASTKDLVIQVQGGKSIPLSSVLSFGG